MSLFSKDSFTFPNIATCTCHKKGTPFDQKFIEHMSETLIRA